MAHGMGPAELHHTCVCAVCVVQLSSVMPRATEPVSVICTGLPRYRGISSRHFHFHFQYHTRRLWGSRRQLLQRMDGPIALVLETILCFAWNQIRKATLFTAAKVVSFSRSLAPFASMHDAVFYFTTSVLLLVYVFQGLG